MGLRRRALSLLVTVALAVPMATATAGPAAAACYDTWTGQQTASKSAALGSLLTYTATVKYKLMTNTCNLGVYTKIQVDMFQDKYSITGDTMHLTYWSDLAHVLMDCSGLTSGCLVYPGRRAYTDNRDFFHTGNGLLTRTAYPGVIYDYSVYSATFDFLTTADGVPYWRFVYQFLRNQIYHDN